MGKFIIKITDEKAEPNVDYYMEWSTVVDAPVTYGMSLEEFKKYYKKEYGDNGVRNYLSERLERVEKNGTSAHPPYDKVENFFNNNRAGVNESQIDKEGILNMYCRDHLG